MKNSLNFVSTCLKVVDTRRIARLASRLKYAGEVFGANHFLDAIN
jgi:hypothetical protein